MNDFSGFGDIAIATIEELSRRRGSEPLLKHVFSVFGMCNGQPASTHGLVRRQARHFHPPLVDVAAVSVAVVHKNADGSCSAECTEELFAFFQGLFG